MQFANSKSLEVLSEIAGSRSLEFILRDNHELLRICREFSFEEGTIYLFLVLDDYPGDEASAELYLQTGAGDEDGVAITIATAKLSNKSKVVKITHKIESLCKVLGPQKDNSRDPELG